MKRNRKSSSFITTVILTSVLGSLISIAPLSANNCSSCFAGDWDLEVNYLYWKLRRSGLDYAYEGGKSTFISAEGGSANVFGPVGELFRINPQYTGGYQVRLTKDLCQSLALSVNYTSYLAKNSSSKVFPENEGTLTPTRQNVTTGIFITVECDKAKSHHTFDLDILDIELNSNFYTSNCRAYLTPFAGIRYERIKQKLNSEYEDLDIKAITQVHEKLHMSGYGAFGGTEFTYCLSPCINFWSKAAFGVLASDFETKFKEYDQNELTTNVFLDQWLGIGELELALGFSFKAIEMWCLPIWVNVGYEFHQWYNFPDFMQMLSVNSRTTRQTCSMTVDGMYVGVESKF